MIFLYSFLVGGLICGISQVILDKYKLTPAHLTSYLVATGAFLDIFGLYDLLIDFAGAGASVPILSFGHSLIHGALEKAYEVGYIGIVSGMFSLTAAGITSAIIFSFFAGILFKPKG